MMMKLRSKKFLRSNSNKGSNNNNNNGGNKSFKGSPEKENGGINNEIKWEVRPGGMLVQKRESGDNNVEEGMITIKVSTVSQFHDISIQSTSTFGDLKTHLSLVTGLHPREQRLLYRGKERENNEHLHMVGVKDKDKVLLLEDPAIKESKLQNLIRGGHAFGTTCRTIIV